jgi:hypothetical protein
MSLPQIVVLYDPTRLHTWDIIEPDLSVLRARPWVGVLAVGQYNHIYLPTYRSFATLVRTAHQPASTTHGGVLPPIIPQSVLSEDIHDMDSDIP